MSTKELIASIADTADISKAAVKRVIDALGDYINASIASGEAVTIPNVGSIKPVKRDAREGRNPATGQAIHIPAKTSVKFKAALSLKNSANA